MRASIRDNASSVKRIRRPPFKRRALFLSRRDRELVEIADLGLQSVVIGDAEVRQHVDLAHAGSKFSPNLANWASWNARRPALIVMSRAGN
jgi:hypothetical protein